MLRISLLPEDVSAIEAPMTQECAAKILNKGPCLSEKLETDLSTIGKQRVAFFILDEIYNNIADTIKVADTINEYEDF